MVRGNSRGNTDARLSLFLLVAAFVASGPRFLASAAPPQVTNLTARHQAGQTLLTFTEVHSPVTSATVAAVEMKKLKRLWAGPDAPRQIRYRVYRSQRPIRTFDYRKPIAELPPLTGWNIDYYGGPRPGDPALRYAVEDGGPPVPPGTGVCAYNPPTAGNAYYAVTAVIDGVENRELGPGNTLAEPVAETVGQGVPVLQRIERPERFLYVDRPTLYYYVRWESPPNCSVQGKPIDYLVGIPPELAKPAPVGLHLHCWGGSLNRGYGWWYGAENGHILVSSNQVPYDWWTGYHERYWDGARDQRTWQGGVVRPYSQRRMLSFLDWVATRWDVDFARTHVAGSSMGGSGAPMFGIRHAERIAWSAGWVGVHIPARSPHFRGSYENVYGPPQWDIHFEDGTPVWDYFDDTWYLRNHPKKEVGLICFSNGKNDSAIGWEQAVAFYRALQETRRPHIFVWGQSGHGQRARLPVSLSDRYMPMDLSTSQSQPAFTGCSLDDDPGDGTPNDGDPQGQSNLYLFWGTDDVVDTPEAWEMTIGLVPAAPAQRCTVDITPRRLQRFCPRPGDKLSWTNCGLDGKEIQRGEVVADRWGLVTLPGVQLSQMKNRIRIAR